MSAIKPKKFCFVICTNNEVMVCECQNYINRLFIPEGYETEILTIIETGSLTSAYNEAIRESDAKYKVYLHQDLYIVNRWFLFNLLDIFNSDESIGLIGMVGTDRMPDSCVMWRGERFGILSASNEEGIYDHRVEKCEYYEAVAVDGAIMVTSKDVSWREDIFDGFDFYDVSQCLEMRRVGYKVVVPKQPNAWCIHDDGYWLNLFNYNKYRERLISEYERRELVLNPDDALADLDDSSEDEYVTTIRNIAKGKEGFLANEQAFKDAFDKTLKARDVNSFLMVGSELVKKAGVEDVFMTGDVQKLCLMAIAVAWENRMGQTTFISNADSISMLMDKYVALELYLRRIEIIYNDSFADEAYRFIDENDISAYIVAQIIFADKSAYFRRMQILQSIADYFEKAGNRDRMIHFIAQIKLNENKQEHG